jgi:hypothetical protein
MCDVYTVLAIGRSPKDFLTKKLQSQILKPNRKSDSEYQKQFWSMPCTENPIYVFPEMKLHGLIPYSYIHVSVSDLYIPRIGKIGRPIMVIYKSLTDT